MGAKHVTKINVYIHTQVSPGLTKAMTMEHTCIPAFYNYRNHLDELIDRARNALLQQEPYHTLLQAGYNLYLREPQLSYKVLAIEENFLIDFVVDINGMSYDTAHPPLPEPFIETVDNIHFSQTDISFRFKVHALEVPVRPKTTESGTMTFDSALVNPILDQIRDGAKLWGRLMTQLDEHTPTNARPNLPTRPTVSLSTNNDAPPRHHLQHDSDRIRQRLGPPVEHEFGPRRQQRDQPDNRSRSSSKESGNTKRQRR
jgi:hypothetical protein